jgi:hypothetical protein
MKKLALYTGFVLVSALCLSACVDPALSSPAPLKNNNIVIKPLYGPPQVIYRIDENRYITLEDYTNCDNGLVIYHNDQKNIKTALWVSSRGIMNYKGKLIWAAKNDDMLALPLVSGDNDPCGDNLRGCAYSILSASHDGGKKFRKITFSASSSSSSKNHEIVITDDAIFINKYRYSVNKYAINNDGEFYNVRQAWISEEFHAGMLKWGVPEDVLDKSKPMGYHFLLLTEKYHYSDAQSKALGIKAGALFHKLNNSPSIERLPEVKRSPLASDRFSCNTALIPAQPTH